MSIYKCKKCGWTGSESELEKEQVDTCFGSDSIDVCPNCGYYNPVEMCCNHKLDGDNKIVQNTTNETDNISSVLIEENEK